MRTVTKCFRYFEIEHLRTYIWFATSIANRAKYLKSMYGLFNYKGFKEY